MTDGTPPNEGNRSDPSGSSTPSPDLTPTPGAASAPVPPYAAPVPPNSGQVRGAPPYAGYPAPSGYAGGPRQEYPGAPPTWGPGPGGQYRPGTPPSGGSQILAILALMAAVLGFFAAFVPFIGWLFAVFFLLAAVVLAIIALVTRAPGKGLAIAALIVAAAGVVIGVLWAVGAALFGGFLSALPGPDSFPDPTASEYSYPSLTAPDLGAAGASVDDPLPAGTTIDIFDVTAGEDVWEMTVQPLQDVTAAASAEAGEVPLYGAYIAVPVELTNVSDHAIDISTGYEYVPYSRLVTGDGGQAEVASFYNTEQYPGSWDIGEIEPGETVTYYEIFDTGAEVATSGRYAIELGSGQSVFWGPAAS